MSEERGSGILWTIICQTGDWRCSSVYMIGWSQLQNQLNNATFHLTVLWIRLKKPGMENCNMHMNARETCEVHNCNGEPSTK